MTTNDSKHYAFESANKGTVTIYVTGEYHDGCKDVEVSFGGSEERFEEINDADEVMGWLVDNGVKFEGKRSALFNRAYIQSVMIDGDATEGDLLAEFAALSDEEVSRKYATWFE